MDDTLPWDSAPHLPWQPLMNPADQWQALPSFLVGEYVIITCAVLALVHAFRHGRGNLLVWLAALIAGTANDMIFMALPLVDNFWQAQATIMITPRLPLYIPCMYVVFMYYPTVAVRRLGLPRWGSAALTGLAACAFYAPYDIIGAKFLWWTWHDTDAPTADRILGAPVSSSLWVLTFVGAFAWLLDRVLRDSSVISARTFLKGLALVALFTTLLMMLQFQLLQAIQLGKPPGYLAFALGLGAYAAVAAGQWRKAERPKRGTDWLGRAVVASYFATFVIIMVVFAPEEHVSAGIHQPPGECYVEATDITGVTRHKYLCVDDFEEDYTFDCTQKPPAQSAWYTVCGREHRSFWAHMIGVAWLGGGGTFVFALMFGPRRERRATAHAPSV